MFGSMAGFSESADRMALFPVLSNPRWRLSSTFAACTLRIGKFTAASRGFPATARLSWCCGGGECTSSWLCDVTTAVEEYLYLMLYNLCFLKIVMSYLLSIFIQRCQLGANKTLKGDAVHIKTFGSV